MVRQDMRMEGRSSIRRLTEEPPIITWITQ